MKRYGGGWECDRGYQSVRRSCVAIAVPTNAYLDSSGRGWHCSRGYREDNGACAKVEVPPHAFLGSRGSEWKCDRGYRRADQSCVAIEVPENAYLESSGGPSGVLPSRSNPTPRRPSERSACRPALLSCPVAGSPPPARRRAALRARPESRRHGHRPPVGWPRPPTHHRCPSSTVSIRAKTRSTVIAVIHRCPTGQRRR